MVDILMGIALVCVCVCLVALKKQDGVLLDEIEKLRAENERLMSDYQSSYTAMLSCMDDQDEQIVKMSRIVSNVNNYVQTLKNTPVKGKHAKD